MLMHTNNHNQILMLARRTKQFMVKISQHHHLCKEEQVKWLLENGEKHSTHPNMHRTYLHKPENSTKIKQELVRTKLKMTLNKEKEQELDQLSAT